MNAADKRGSIFIQLRRQQVLVQSERFETGRYLNSDAHKRREIALMMRMDMALLARQRHYERIEHALGPRPEPYGPQAPSPMRRSFAQWSRIAHLARLPALLIPQVTSRRT
jgi:hypothetical protein